MYNVAEMLPRRDGLRNDPPRNNEAISLVERLARLRERYLLHAHLFAVMGELSEQRLRIKLRFVSHTLQSARVIYK